MKVFVKIHQQPYGVQIIAICDEKIIGKKLSSGNKEIQISERFYKGELIEIEEALKILSSSNNFNIIGKNIVNAAIKKGIINEDGIILLENIPHAIKFYI